MNSKRSVITLILIFFSLIFSSISLVNHYLLRTYALDLGMFNHALYMYSNFNEVRFTLGLSETEYPFLATHFSVLIAIFAPFRFIFGSYTLLIIQIASIIFGSLGIYKYASDKLPNQARLSKFCLIHFLSIWGIYSALSFDFHMNVIGTMFIPWFIYYFEKKHHRNATLLLILALLSIETMSIWLIFIITALLIKNKKSNTFKSTKIELAQLVFCIVYALVILGYCMPELQDSSTNLQLERYDKPGEIIQTFFTHPIDFFYKLFSNTTNDVEYNGIKLETTLMFLFSGGILIIFRPIYLLMLIPIVSFKFLSNDYSLWGINNQYSIELTPIISFIVIDFLSLISKKRMLLLTIITLLTFGSTIQTIISRKSKWYEATNSIFFKSGHYQSKLDVSSIKKALELIPNDASVSCSSPLAPQLAFRKNIYHFPYTQKADFIALITLPEYAYPLTSEAYDNKLKNLSKNKHYQIVHQKFNLLILKKLNKKVILLPKTSNLK